MHLIWMIYVIQFYPLDFSEQAKTNLKFEL